MLQYLPHGLCGDSMRQDGDRTRNSTWYTVHATGILVAVRTFPGCPVIARCPNPAPPSVPRPLTRLGQLERALAPLRQAHDGHHLGPKAAAPLLGCGGPGPPARLLGAADFTTDAGAPNHIPGGRSRGRTRLPVKHGLRGGKASGNPGGEGRRQRGPTSGPGATLLQPATP